MARESAFHTLFVATMLCVVCSLLVSMAAVGLRPWQLQNKEQERQKNILMVAGLYRTDEPVETLFQQIDTRIVDLETGEFVGQDVVAPSTFDPKQAASDPEMSALIPPEHDIAGIKRREKYAFVYLVQRDGRLDQMVLPVYGKGLWSTMYGFLSLAADGTTVRGISFYEHGETPGLGGEIDNADWKASWKGKRVRDESGQFKLKVVKGAVDPSSPEAAYEVDGISGATITANGVSNMVAYWLGPHGFGSFLARQRAPEVTP